MAEEWEKGSTFKEEKMIETCTKINSVNAIQCKDRFINKERTFVETNRQNASAKIIICVLSISCIRRSGRSER